MIPESENINNERQDRSRKKSRVDRRNAEKTEKEILKQKKEQENREQECRVQRHSEWFAEQLRKSREENERKKV